MVTLMRIVLIYLLSFLKLMQNDFSLFGFYPFFEGKLVIVLELFNKIII